MRRAALPQGPRPQGQALLSRPCPDGERNGLIVEACVTRADGHGERNAALTMIEPRAARPSKITVGADRASTAKDFVNEMRAMNVTPSSWDNDYIDFVELGFIGFADCTMGEMAFGVAAALDCALDKTRRDVSFDFAGSHEGDKVSGNGWAEVSGPRRSPARPPSQNGDDTTFEARRR